MFDFYMQSNNVFFHKSMIVISFDFTTMGPLHDFMTTAAAASGSLGVCYRLRYYCFLTSGQF